MAGAKTKKIQVDINRLNKLDDNLKMDGTEIAVETPEVEVERKKNCI